MTEDQIEYVEQNIPKHRLALWVVGLITYFCWGEMFNLDRELLVAFFAMGSALSAALIVGWFAMSLKSLPSRYGTLGILITFFMFTAFMSGAMIIPLAIAALTGNPRLIVGGILGIVALYETTLLYDFGDVLNIGLEPLQKRYYQDPQVRILERLERRLEEMETPRT